MVNYPNYYKKFFKVALNNHREISFKSIKNIVGFVLAAHQNKDEISHFLNRMDTIKQVDFKLPDEKLGVIKWPYIHNNWDIKHKMQVIAGHYELMSSTNPALVLDENKANYKVIDLSHISQNITIVIDIAQWFLREGELVINIFREDLRVASIAFSTCVYDNEKIAFIGAIQGIHSGVSTEESLEIYRMLTKDFEGLRPRSLLLEVLKMVLAQLSIQKIYAISEQRRHHRHAYFGNNQDTVFKSDYNAFWEEHGGILNAENGFYELPLNLSIKDLSEIASKKRSLYKRRYEVIGEINNNIQASMTQQSNSIAS